MTIRDWLELVGMATASMLAFLALRFSNSALQGRLDLLKATQELRESFESKLTQLSSEVNQLRQELNRDTLAPRVSLLERRLRLAERDNHWTRNMFAAILTKLLPEADSEALLEKVNRHIASRWTDND